MDPSRENYYMYLVFSITRKQIIINEVSSEVTFSRAYIQYDFVFETSAEYRFKMHSHWLHFSDPNSALCVHRNILLSYLAKSVPRHAPLTFQCYSLK